MSLDTVLQIGKVLRGAEDSLKYSTHVASCPKDKDGNWPLCISIPVNSDFTFNWNGIKITPENERSKLYYLKFKTSKNDGRVKYVFGDIFFGQSTKIAKDSEIEHNELGYYRLENPEQPKAFRASSFERGVDDYNEIIQSTGEGNIFCIQKMHEELDKNIARIERILKFISAIHYFFDNSVSAPFEDYIDNIDGLTSFSAKQNYKELSAANLKKLELTANFSELNETQKLMLSNLTNAFIFVHFEFSREKHWYQFNEDMNFVNAKILSDFVEKTSYGLVLKKTLYKTLCSGDKTNDIQFPAFQISNKYKSKLFKTEELQDLFYAIDYTSHGKLISGTDIKLIVLPCGEHLTAKDYSDFLEKRNEAAIVEKNKNISKNADDSLFNFFAGDEKNITSFDLIFCKKGGLSSPDTDLIELSGIEKSKLKQIRQRIRLISQDVYYQRSNVLKIEKELTKFEIGYSFRRVLGNPQTDLKTGKVLIKANPKYQSHLLKVIPLIFSGNYFHDEVLLPAFIQNVEYTVRAGDVKYNFLKFDLKFLYKIQNTKNDKFMEITTSKSYQIGLLLGELARNLSQEIKSFEKNYVGNLSRRIVNLSDFIKLKNEIEQKLIMHDKSKYTYQTSYDLAQRIKEFNMRYDKDECAFGFMESYFKPLSKKDPSAE